MAVRNIYEEWMGLGGKQPITLSFTGAANVDVDSYYLQADNMVYLYVPQFNVLTTANGSLIAELPFTIQNATNFIGISLNDDASEMNSITIGREIDNQANLTITGSIAGTGFASGTNCGTYSGQTLAFNLN